MRTIDYRAMAEEWVKHITQQSEQTRICANDLALIEHLLKVGFTLIAVRGQSKVLRVDFLGKRGFKPLKAKKLAAA